MSSSATSSTHLALLGGEAASARCRSSTSLAVAVGTGAAIISSSISTCRRDLARLQLVHEDVVHDGEEPRPQVARPPQVELAHRALEGVLHQVVGAVAVAHQRPRVAAQVGDVRDDQLVVHVRARDPSRIMRRGRASGRHTCRPSGLLHRACALRDLRHGRSAYAPGVAKVAASARARAQARSEAAARRRGVRRWLGCAAVHWISVGQLPPQGRRPSRGTPMRQRCSPRASSRTSTGSGYARAATRSMSSVRSTQWMSAGPRASRACIAGRVEREPARAAAAAAHRDRSRSPRGSGPGPSASSRLCVPMRTCLPPGDSRDAEARLDPCGALFEGARGDDEVVELGGRRGHPTPAHSVEGDALVGHHLLHRGAREHAVHERA